MQSDYSALVERLNRGVPFRGLPLPKNPEPNTANAEPDLFAAVALMAEAATAITTLQAELAASRQANAASVDDHKSQSVIDNTACVAQTIDKPRYKLGDFVQKKRGSSWRGVVVGFYSTVYTPIGYCVDSAFEPGSVQVWPEAALEDWDGAA